MIVDSGDRTLYDTGAVRDMKEGKGRFDLVPLNIIANCLNDNILRLLSLFQRTNNDEYLEDVLVRAGTEVFNGHCEMFLEVAKHFEEGAKKYGEHNWEKGIPEWSYLDSAVRHYLKWYRGDDDERHDRAFVWNVMALIWTHNNIEVNTDENS